MPLRRELRVYLIPELIGIGGLPGGIAVVIDVLRASTTIVHALAAGANAIVPCASIDDAIRHQADHPERRVRTAGERLGVRIPGFDLGNSPGEFTAAQVRGSTIAMTTTNGTTAILRSLGAKRVLIGSFVNFSAVCEQLDADRRPVHLVCAGAAGEPSMEDTLLAGAIVDHLCDTDDMHLNDAARMAWDVYENHGHILAGALETCDAGEKLAMLGHAPDVRLAAQVDQFAIVAEVRREPVRVELSAAGIKRRYWPKQS